MMQFLGYFRSSSSYRCRIAFNLKGVGYQFQSVHLKNGAQKAPEFTELNPQRLLPVLITDEGEALYQSLAILEWLDETHPTPPLLPSDPVARAKVRAFSQIIACEIHPLQNLRVLSYLRGELGLDEGAVNAWLARWLREGLEACEGHLAKEAHGGPFCFGNAPGLADICLVPQVFSAQRFGVDITDLTRVSAINAACQALPEFAAAHPAKQPDFEA
jgi:maleylacetoacetate isomerase